MSLYQDWINAKEAERAAVETRQEDWGQVMNEQQVIFDVAHVSLADYLLDRASVFDDSKELEKFLRDIAEDVDDQGILSSTDAYFAYESYLTMRGQRQWIKDAVKAIKGFKKLTKALYKELAKNEPLSRLD